MKKGKFAQHVFIILYKLKLQLNLQIFLHAPMPKISTRDFFSITSEFRNSHNLHQIDKKSNRKPMRLPMIDFSDLCSFNYFSEL